MINQNYLTFYLYVQKKVSEMFLERHSFANIKGQEG